MSLRSLPGDRDDVWQAIVDEHFAHHLLDKNLHGLDRQLPQNEVSAMALNEMAVRHKRGFFYYLPSREAWKTPDSETLLPRGRVPMAPGAAYPTLIYTSFIWSERCIDTYRGLTQRARWLRSNPLVAYPPSNAPLHPMQYIDHAKAPIYRTSKPSLILLSTKVCFYVLSTIQYESVVGLWSSQKRYKPSGSDPELRLDQAPWIWHADKREQENELDKYNAMQAFRCNTIQDVYGTVLRRCAFLGDTQPSFNLSGLRLVIPRAPTPQGGIPLGSAMLDSDSYVNPSLHGTRRKTRKSRRSRSRDRLSPNAGGQNQGGEKAGKKHARAADSDEDLE